MRTRLPERETWVWNAGSGETCTTFRFLLRAGWFLAAAEVLFCFCLGFPVLILSLVALAFVLAGLAIFSQLRPSPSFARGSSLPTSLCDSWCSTFAHNGEGVESSSDSTTRSALESDVAECTLELLVREAGEHQLKNDKIL